MRAQAHTLEGVAAALLVVATVAFTLQATAVTPLTASTASQHIETQHERAASGLLATERANGNLSRTLRYWNGSAESFANAGGDGYYVGNPPDAGSNAVGNPPNASFFRALEETFGDRAVAYNVNVRFVAGDARDSRRVVYNGEPSSDAATATRVVTLYDDQSNVTLDGGRFVPAADGETLAAMGDERYFAPDAPGHEYAVVEVEVVVWRM